jgi:hypothetical protein
MIRQVLKNPLQVPRGQEILDLVAVELGAVGRHELGPSTFVDVLVVFVERRDVVTQHVGVEGEHGGDAGQGLNAHRISLR